MLVFKQLFTFFKVCRNMFIVHAQMESISSGCQFGETLRLKICEKCVRPIKTNLKVCHMNSGKWALYLIRFVK
jgi:hypothetical protein